MPSAKPAQRRRALELAAATGLPVLTVPSAAELADPQRRNQRVRGTFVPGNEEPGPAKKPEKKPEAKPKS